MPFYRPAMATIRNALDRLGRDALVLLGRTRDLPGARSNDDRATQLARSYRGDAATFLADLRRADLLEILRQPWSVDGVDYRAAGITGATKEELQRVALPLFTGEPLPSCFVRMDGVASELPRDEAAEPEEDLAEEESSSERRSWIDEALERGSNALDERVDRVLPSWLVRLDTPTTSRDPLGLQALAGANADAILPGLNVFTSRARYYSFLCWSVAKAQEHADPGTHLERVHRLERLLVLCEALRHRDDPDACSYVGRRRGKAFVREHTDGRGWPLPTRILKNQTGNGALRLYRTSLVDLGLVDEDDVRDGLGLELTDKGRQLAAKYGERLDAGIVRWALDGSEQRKRWDTLESLAEVSCLTAPRIDRHERRHLVEALFGKSVEAASPSAAQRRETARLLMAHGLLGSLEVRDDIAAEDDDAVTDDGGAAAAAAETRGNWAVVRTLLDLPARDELADLQRAAAYEILAMSLNRLIFAMIESVHEPGRLAIASWLDRIAEHAGDAFASGSANAWGSGRAVVPLADALLAESAWPAVAASALALLIALLRDPKMVAWVQDVVLRDAFLSGIVELRHTLDGRTPLAVLEELVHALALRHRNESARKGKGEWILVDGADLVRADPRTMRPIVHSLRFAQLQQIAADLALRPEELADAS